jgi:antitoxin SocA-like protein
MTICKELYFADKRHLLQFGRPITGDRYYKIQQGQVPTRGLDMLRHRPTPAANALLEKYVSVIGNSVHPKKLDKSVFSKSDLEVLDWVVKHFGHKTAAELRKLAHREHTYLESEEGCPIDFALFFKGHPDSEAVWSLAEQEQESRDVLARYAITE